MPPPPPKLDPRRHALRDTLADAALKGRVEAPAFAAGVPAQIMRAAVPLRREPIAALPFETEALFGETVRVFDTADGWAWVQLDLDRYVGYVPANTIGDVTAPATHQIGRAHV